MKYIKIGLILIAAFSLVSCDAIKKATNTTGSAFTLTGQWQLTSNTPDNTLLTSKVTVKPVLSEASITTLVGTGNCVRENDVTWKSISPDTVGGFSISNLVSACSGLNYQPAIIYVINNNEIRLTGKNTSGQDITQLWKRVI